MARDPLHSKFPPLAPRQVHLFDGYGMIVKFTIADGKVSVANRCAVFADTLLAAPGSTGCRLARRSCLCCRFVETNAWKAFRDTGKPRFGEFGTPLPSLVRIEKKQYKILAIQNEFKKVTKRSVHRS